MLFVFLSEQNGCLTTSLGFDLMHVIRKWNEFIILYVELVLVVLDVNEEILFVLRMIFTLFPLHHAKLYLDKLLKFCIQWLGPVISWNQFKWLLNSDLNHLFHFLCEIVAAHAVSEISDSYWLWYSYFVKIFVVIPLKVLEERNFRWWSVHQQHEFLEMTIAFIVNHLKSKFNRF